MHRPEHLCLQVRDLFPSAEWTVQTAGWRILRLDQGVCYCLKEEPTLSLSPGDVLLLPPEHSVILRASKLGPVEFHYFDFQPDLLTGLLTLTERNQFHDIARSSSSAIWLLPGTDPIARQFTELCEKSGETIPLLERTQMLAIAAALLAPGLGQARPPAVGGTAARARFEELMNGLPQAELLNRSARDLASLCHCSPRYFIRLFRAQFGESFRARQICLRLERARELLQDPGAEVNAVAVASGYTSLRMFALHFRRKFGISPATWRKSRQDPPQHNGGD